MSKRKAKKYNKSKSNDNAIINNIDKLEVKTEIDYDKLAEAIVKAQEKVKEEDNKEGNEILGLHKKGLSIIYDLISIVGWGCFMLLIVNIGFAIADFKNDVLINIDKICFSIMFGIIIFYISSKMKALSDSVIKLKDKQLIVALTSSAVSFVALVVSIIALIISKI